MPMISLHYCNIPAKIGRMNPFNDRDNDVRSITGIAAIYGKDELPLNPIWDNIVTAPVSALFEDPLCW